MNFAGPMDLKTTKRTILERIAKIDDTPRLLALKRWCVRQDQYFDRNWKVVPPSKAVDSEVPIFRVMKRTYTAAEVRALLDEVRLTFESDPSAPFLSRTEIAKLDRDYEDMKSGKVKGIPWEKVKERLAKTVKAAKPASSKARTQARS